MDHGNCSHCHHTILRTIQLTVVTLSPYNLMDHGKCNHSITIQSHGPRQVQSLYHHTISWTTANRSHSVIIQSHSWTTATVVSRSPYSLMDHIADCSQSITKQSRAPRQLQSLCHNTISRTAATAVTLSPVSYTHLTLPTTRSV